MLHPSVGEVNEKILRLAIQLGRSNRCCIVCERAAGRADVTGRGGFAECPALEDPTRASFEFGPLQGRGLGQTSAVDLAGRCSWQLVHEIDDLRNHVLGYLRGTMRLQILRP